MHQTIYVDNVKEFANILNSHFWDILLPLLMLLALWLTTTLLSKCTTLKVK